MSVLGSTGGGGNYINYAARADAWQIDKINVPIKTIVFDHETIKSGWGKIMTGMPPEWQFDESIGQHAKIPSDEKDAKGKLLWKRGFLVELWTKATGKVQWSSTGVGAYKGFDELLDIIWDQKASNVGKVPVVEYTGSEHLKAGQGDTRKPLFKLIKWVDRASIAWDAEAAEAPAPKPAPKPEPVDDDIEF